MIALEQILDRYLSVFPGYTDHSMLHCLDVMNMCNQLIGPSQIDRLNADEMYVLLMSVILHDVGMGISQKQIEEYIAQSPEMKTWRETHPHKDYESMVRLFHNELSALFVMKYADMLDLPNQRYAHAVAQVAKGHRSVDLYDDGEYPSDYEVAPGRKVCLKYLAVLIRLADELDIGSARNLNYLFDTASLIFDDNIGAFESHKAIRTVNVLPDAFMVDVYATNRNNYRSASQTVQKLDEVLQYCIKLVDERTPFRIAQREILLNIRLDESELSIDPFKRGGHLVMTLGGKLNADTAPELESVLSRSTDGVRNVTLDLDGLQELSSDGLRVLLGMRKFAIKRGGSFALIHPNEYIREVLTVSGFSYLLN